MTYELSDAEGEALEPSFEPLFRHVDGLTMRLNFKIEKACKQMLRERSFGVERGVLVKADRETVELSEDVPFGRITYEPMELS